MQKKILKLAQQGFAFPLALMIGFIMLGVGISMIAKSQGDQSKVIAQKLKADGLSVSEVGVTQLLELFNKNRLLATYNNISATDNWSETATQTALTAALIAQQANDCVNPRSSPDSSLIQAQLEEIQDLGSGETMALADNRTYSLLKYRYNGERFRYDGTRYVSAGVVEGVIDGHKGTVTQSVAILDGSAGLDQGKSLSRIEVEIPVISQREGVFPRYELDPSDNTRKFINPYSRTNPNNTNPNIPGLWIKEGATDDLQFPIFPENGNYERGARFDSYVLMSDRCSFEPRLQGFISRFVTEHRIDPVETSNYDARFVQETFPSLPSIPDNLPANQTALSLTLNDGQSLVFPRGGDVASVKRTIGYIDPVNPSNNIASENASVYEYRVNNINLSGDATIKITPGTKVIFYLNGNLNTSSTSGITHDCSPEAMEEVGATTCRSTDFQIFAYNNLESTDPKICLRNNRRLNNNLALEAFIFAPDYDIGKTGNAKFIGSIWGKSWGKISNCGSVEEVVGVAQKGEWGYLYHNLVPAEPLPRIGQVREWKQIPTN